MEQTEQEWEALVDWAEHRMELPINSPTARRGADAARLGRQAVAQRTARSHSIFGAVEKCAGMPDDELLAQLVTAVRQLDPQPRERRWVSLSFCVLDAVYSIGADYDAHVVPVVRRVAADFDISAPSVPMSVEETEDPVPLDRLLDRYPDMDALVRTSRNLQYTSPRGGIRKADAVLRYAAVLRDHDVRTVQEARALWSDGPRFDAVEAALRKVPGEGANGVRRGYLWMLVGDADTVKPDRMVLRWLSRNGAAVTVESARVLLARIAAELSTGGVGRRVTPWEVDHAIWLAARTRR